MKRVSLFAFDFILLGATLILMVVGILFVYSSGMSFTGMQLSNEYVKQLIWSGTGLLLMIGVIMIDYHRLRRLAVYLYAFLMLLLLVTPFIGREVHGARSWIGIGEFGIQPSEFAKIATILFLAGYFAGIGKGVRELPRFMLGLAIVVLPIGLILLQPDMGTALVYIPIFVFMAFVAGAKLRHIFYLVAVGLLMIILAVAPLYEQWIVGREATLLSIITDFQIARYFLAAALLVTLLSAWGFWGFKRWSCGFFGNIRSCVS